VVGRDGGEGEAHRHVGNDFGGRGFVVAGGATEEGYSDGVAGEFCLYVAFVGDPFSATEGYFAVVGDWYGVDGGDDVAGAKEVSGSGIRGWFDFPYHDSTVRFLL